MVRNSKLRNKLEVLPDKPGVYLFKDKEDTVIYVGKAKHLRSRVRSYFTCENDGRYQYPRLIASIRDLEIILTRNEVEALSTEAALIKKYSPKYNVDLRDDKSFPYLKITREPFPRISLTRKPHTQKANYYGPYTNVKEVRSLIRAMRGILQICNCNLPLKLDRIEQGKYKLCLDYHIGRCAGPCVGKITSEEYLKNVKRFIQFLNGRHDEIMKALANEMNKLAAKLRFEEAATVRDRLVAARRFSERQRKISIEPVDRDAVSLAREDNFAAFSVIKVRGGRIVGQSPFYMERAAELDNESLMEAFIVRHYDLVDTIPGEIYLQIEPPDKVSLSSYLSGLAKKKVSVAIPIRGDKRKLIETAQRNAEHLLLERRLTAEKRDFIPRAVKALQEQLKLPSPPLLIEAFDISNLHGTDSVASMVSFKDGKPWKTGYRMFKIKTVEGIDDFASIAEAVRRRYTRLKGVGQVLPSDTTSSDSVGQTLLSDSSQSFNSSRTGVSDLLNDSKSRTGVSNLLNDSKSRTGVSNLLNDPKSRTGVSNLLNDSKSRTGVSNLLNDPKSQTGVSDLLNDPKSRTGVSNLLNDPKSQTGVSDLPNESTTFPNLILVDGGLGQLSAAKGVLDELNLPDLPIIGLAKRLEEIYLPGRSEPLMLPRTSSALRLLQQIRDEAHRFAITRHRMLRGKRQVKSRLDDIDGLGPIRRQNLLKRFGSVKRISEAKVNEIASTPGISLKLAKIIKTSLSSYLK
ncbi:MAG: excinuclease ABC subunit UvrC [Candidatus Hatepunaea meridiana]|nr:excinuclease ABC subunit UvrC [Candidatus Hatepunaea meridiana]